LLRCEQRLDTVLEGMGNRSVYNCVKALALANLFAEKRALEGGAAAASGTEEPQQRPVARIGFLPFLARAGASGGDQLQWMQLKVVVLDARPRATRPGSGDKVMKVSGNTDLAALQSAVIANWGHQCAGSAGETWIAAMGAESTGRAVKGAAFALAGIKKRESNWLLFFCFPAMELVDGTDRNPGQPQTVTYLRLEPRPS